MATPRKLSPEQERDVALAYLCGVRSDFIGERYDVSNATIRGNIVGKRSPEWQDPLVDFYRETDPGNRESNSVHLFLSFRDGDHPVEPTGLVDSRKDGGAFDIVQDAIYNPGIERVIDATALDRYVDDRGPYDHLVRAIFGELRAYDAVHSLLVDKLREKYEPQAKLSLRSVLADVSKTVVEKVKDGGLAWTDLKKGLVREVLSTLTEREQKVLGMRFGLDGYLGPGTLEKVGQDFSLTGNRIRQIEARALRKLRHPTRSKNLVILHGLATESDVREYAEQMHERQERVRWRAELYQEIRTEVLAPFTGDAIEAAENAVKRIDELEFSVRTYNGLAQAGIRTIGELAGWTEAALLNSKHFSRKSVKEIKEVLDGIGVALA